MPIFSKIFYLEVTENSQKTNISYSLIRTRTCAYLGVRNVCFSENFAHVLNDYSLKTISSNLSNPKRRVKIKQVFSFWKELHMTATIHYLLPEQFC